MKSSGIGRAIAKAVILFVAAGLCHAVYADSDQRRAPGSRAAAGATTASEAATIALKQSDGRVLRVERNGSRFRVKVITAAGEVRLINVPAR